MTIRAKLTQKDFINASFLVMYKKLFAKVFTILGVIILVVSVFVIPYRNKSFTVSQVTLPLFMLLWLPLLTYFGARRNFRSNPRIQETIEYEFDKDFLSLKGESFTTQMSWDKIFKVEQSKNWILIWVNPRVANVIPRKEIWEGKIYELKEILQHHKVKNNL